MQLYWGDNLRFLRKKYNLTQTKLSEKLKINSNNFSNYENGGFPKVETVLLLKDFYEVSLDELFYLDMRNSKKFNSNEKNIQNEKTEKESIKTLNHLKMENKMLLERLKDKEEIIELLRSKLGKG